MRLAGLCGCVSKVFAVEIARWTDKCAEKSKTPAANVRSGQNKLCIFTRVRSLTSKK